MKRIGLIGIFLFFAFTWIKSQDTQTIHVMVALCDNKYQGVVKVPKAIGNGQDPDNNLYWGCAYGVRTYFKKKPDWKEVKRYKVDDIKLERVVFKHKTKPYYLVADAYDGRNIKDCTVDFLNSCAGRLKDTIRIENVVIGISGNAKSVVYVGHNGLMDFKLLNVYENKDGKTRDVIILACAAKQYFKSYLQSAGANPLLWSTHLMSPEAYTLYYGITVYINGGDADAVRNSAAAAYSKYQKCSLKAAKNLIVTGW